MANQEASHKGASFVLPEEPLVTSHETPIFQETQGMSSEQALRLAMELRQQNELFKAIQILEGAIKQSPRDPRLFHIIGVIFNEVGQVDKGITFILKAIDLNPNAAIFHANLTEIYRNKHDLVNAYKHGLEAATLNPNLPNAHGNLGVVYFDKGEYDQAIACHQKALQLNPNYLPSLNNLGSIYSLKGDLNQASEYYRRALAFNPDNVQIFNNLMTALIQTDRAQEALMLINDFLSTHPDSAETICNQGFAYMNLGETGKALVSFNQAIGLREEYAAAHMGIARAYVDLHKIDEAEEQALRAIELQPDKAEYYSSLGAIKVANGQSDKAIPLYQKALEMNPEALCAKLGLGNVLLEKGDIDDAVILLKGVLSKDPDNIGALFSLIQASKCKPDDHLVKVMKGLARHLDKSSDNMAILVNYAMGKINDDLGSYDQAFPYYIDGANLKRQTFNYDPDKREEHFASIKDIFTTEYIKEHKGNGFKSDKPIFIIGMPRSGTTLTEQIISSHSDVYGAGELSDMMEIAGRGIFPRNIPHIKKGQLKKLGEQYVDRISSLSGKNYKKVTDKMPANFLHVGLIHLILPRAKIIHIKRHPLDTCISCFTRLFQYNQDQTYDLHELGRYYKQYNDLMNYWRDMLPTGAFYDIRYEDLIEDTENNARALLEFCDLSWDENCLEFYKNKRSIRTASVTQVRKPIYKSSLARWKKYESFLEPLIDGLDDALKGETGFE